MAVTKRQIQEVNRMQAMKLLKQGWTAVDVAKHFNVSRQAVYNWIALFAEGGQNGLIAKNGAGRPPKLSAVEMRWIALTVRDNTPNQLCFPFGLWTLGLIADLIERQFKWRPSKPVLIRIMRTLGFTVQRPIHRSWQQNDVLVHKWHTEDYPKIVTRAKALGASIFFADEAGLRSDYHAGTTWAPIGKTPIVKDTGKRFGVQMLSAINAMGEIKFMLHEGRTNSEVFIQFLRQLMLNETRTIFLILDNSPIHKSQEVKDYVASTNGKLELYYLPPYSPELNPDEQVWKNLKERVSKQVPKDKNDMMRLITQAFEYLQKASNIICSFFRHPECRYAM